MMAMAGGIGRNSKSEWRSREIRQKPNSND
jgi:hypothetical protein